MTMRTRGYGWLEVTGCFTFTSLEGATFKVKRVEGFKGSKKTTRFEMYRVGSDGTETFLRYAPEEWMLRKPCTTCGAAAHEACRSVGLLTTKGTPMGALHAARRRMAEEG